MLSLLPRVIAKRLFIAYGILTRAMTLGVRIIVRDEDSHVLLIRHTYVKGWHLPGGGVERGETLVEAACKELLEEARIEAIGPMQHFHTYRNPKNSRFDHVALFICEEWASLRDWKPSAEIAEIGFFDTTDLPEGTTVSTRARLAEVLNAQPASDIW